MPTLFHWRTVLLLRLMICGALLPLGCQQKLTSPANHHATEWKEFRAEDSLFLVKMPGTPSISRRFADGVEIDEFRCETSQFAVQVMHERVRPEFAGPRNADRLFDKLRDELAKRFPGAKLVNQAPKKQSGCPAREWEVEQKGVCNRVLLVQHQDQLFVLEVITRTGQSWPEDAQVFFDSFNPDLRIRYADQRKTFQSRLVRHDPSPQPFLEETLLSGVNEVTYPSGDLTLKAWLAIPKSNEPQKHPALVFFHAGFAFGAEDFLSCEPFRQAGFVVMAPMLRGENGNPGSVELLWGEIDDASAAIKWLSQHPAVDADRIFAFGEHVGGNVVSLLSLREGLPLRHGGSVSTPDGMFFNGLGNALQLPEFGDAPFDSTDPKERALRMLPGNVLDMQRRHFAFGGIDEHDVLVPPGTDSLLVVKPRVPVHEAIYSYLNICQTDLGLPVTKFNPQQSFAAQPQLPPSIQAKKSELAGRLALAQSPVGAAEHFLRAAFQYLDAKNREGALQAARQCEAALEQLAPDGIENARGTFASHRYRSLGDAFFQAGDSKAAIPHYKTALQFATRQMDRDECRERLKAAEEKANE